MERIQIVHRPAGRPVSSPFRLDTARTVRAFHRTFPEYAPTPLVSLDELAARLGVAGLYVKDESGRFGLGAFKVLGGSWCIGRWIARRLGIPLEELSCGRLTAPEVREALGELTFVTATDGNHGRGVAWTAARLGANSVVYLPRGSASERLENIRSLGGRAEITPWSYDDTVRFAGRQAEEQGWILVQDTSWEGYEELPAWIMEGYTTMALEILEQLGEVRPTHLLLQAGVGAMAGAVAGFFADALGADCPAVTVVEPSRADCLFRTARAADGRLHSAEGDLDTIMAGLNCGEPCRLGWEVLDACAQNFLAIPDRVAARGMRILGSPLGADRRIISGESGAATVGALAEVMEREDRLRQQLGLDRDSRVLCISTEGDTDRESYRRIVWDGRYPDGGGRRNLVKERTGA